MSEQKTKNKNVTMIPSAVTAMKDPYVCLLVTEAQLVEIIYSVNHVMNKRNSSARYERQKKGTNIDASLPDRKFTLAYDPLFTTLTPYMANISNEGKEIDRAAMMRFVYSSAVQWMVNAQLQTTQASIPKTKFILPTDKDNANTNKT